MDRGGQQLFVNLAPTFPFRLCLSQKEMFTSTAEDTNLFLRFSQLSQPNRLDRLLADQNPRLIQQLQQLDRHLLELVLIIQPEDLIPAVPERVRVARVDFLVGEIRRIRDVGRLGGVRCARVGETGIGGCGCGRRPPGPATECRERLGGFGDGRGGKIAVATAAAVQSGRCCSLGATGGLDGLDPLRDKVHRHLDMSTGTCWLDDSARLQGFAEILGTREGDLAEEKR